MDIKDEIAEKVLLCGIYLGLLGALINGKMNEEELPPVRTKIIQLDNEDSIATQVVSPIIQDEIDKQKIRILK